jgi:hypothetical protein
MAEVPLVSSEPICTSGMIGGEDHEICNGCGCPVDPETCGCGDAIDDPHDNHAPVRMGCSCVRQAAGVDVLREHLFTLALLLRPRCGCPGYFGDLRARFIYVGSGPPPPANQSRWVLEVYCTRTNDKDRFPRCGSVGMPFNPCQGSTIGETVRFLHAAIEVLGDAYAEGRRGVIDSPNTEVEDHPAS